MDDSDEDITSYFGILILDIKREDGKTNADIIMADLGPDEVELQEIAEQHCEGKPFLIYQIMQSSDGLYNQVRQFYKENNVPDEELAFAMNAFHKGLQGILDQQEKELSHANARPDKLC